MSNIQVEKTLKRYLKKKLGYSLSILVYFLINANFSFGEELPSNITKEDLISRVKSEKVKLRKMVSKLEKELSNLKPQKDHSIHILFSNLIEAKRNKRSVDNNFPKLIEDWKESLKNKPNIIIPEIRDDIQFTIKDMADPIPDESSIFLEPKFQFETLSGFEPLYIPDLADLNINSTSLPVNKINADRFATDLDNDFSDIQVKIESLTEAQEEDVSQNIKVNIDNPNLNEIVDLSNFIVDEIVVNTPVVNNLESFSLDTVKIKTGSFNQDNVTDYARRGGSNNFYVFKNYQNYQGDSKGFNIWVSLNNIYYDTSSSGGNKKMYLTNGNQTIVLGYENASGQNGLYSTNYGSSTNIPITTTFISDAIASDALINGNFHFTYEGNRNGTSVEKDSYVRMFVSSISKYLNDSSSENIKLSEFTGELSLATTDDRAKQTSYADEKLNGNLVGLEHQFWDYDNNKYSILVNSGTINMGNNINREANIVKAVNKNMIGIMIDSAQSSTFDKTQNNQTINAGTINIMKPSYNKTSTDDRFTPRNNIGISFEEYESGNTPDAILRDDVYIGKINIKNDTKNNYGLKMGNIYTLSPTYFDKTKIIGKTSDNKIYISNDGNTLLSDIKLDKSGNRYIDYTSDIVVEGKQNVGIVVGKSLSSGNPIDNFENIYITVNGNQTVGFLRDKNYSDNNKNDMLINEKNVGNVNFGESAQNSALFKSEMYGITNDTTLNIKGGLSNFQGYNIVLQGLRQSWDKDGDKTNDTNSSGNVTNSSTGKIIGSVNNTIGMMASGTLDDGINSWQNNWNSDTNFDGGKSFASNLGTISLSGNNNIGIAIMNENKGSNSGDITLEGDNGVGIYNTGTFTNSGNVNVSGKNGIGVYNNSIINLKGNINIADNTNSLSAHGNVGIYSEGGTLNFDNSDSTSITGSGNSVAGIYIKDKDGVSSVDVTGNININGTKVGLVTNDITTNIKGNFEYSGNGFALFTKGENGKIIFDKTASLTLGGSAYGFDIIDTTGSNEPIKQSINFNGATIYIKSNDVTLFNIDGNGKDYSSADIESGNGNLPGEEYLKPFVGEINDIVDSYTDNETGETITYNGYKIASIENGNIYLNSQNGNNEKFLKKYKFQKSKIAMSTSTDMTISNQDSGVFFNDEVIGVGISSNKSKDKVSYTKLDDTQINITGSEQGNIALTANRTDEAPLIPNSQNRKSTIGLYIDYGIINVTRGDITVENSLSQSDFVNKESIGIFSKNGSKISVDSNSSIKIYGNSGIGIYGEATKDGKNNKNKFYGDITYLDINNAGNIDVSEGVSGIGIFADGGSDVTKGKVTNSGNIKVSGGTTNNASIGIYGINTSIKNIGNIEVGSNTSDENSLSIGIFAQNSDVTLGDTNSSDIQITLGDYATGVHLDKKSSLVLNSKLIFKSIDSNNTTDRIGIYIDGEANNTTLTLNSDIDISDVVAGRALVVNNRNVTLASGKNIEVSGNTGRGIRALDNAVITNNGTITLTNKGELSSNPEQTPASIGMMASGNNGTIANNGSIIVNSNNGIGIYLVNNENSQNHVTSLGTIELKSHSNIGVFIKESTFNLTGLSANEIAFKEDSNKNIAIYLEDSQLSINKEMEKNFTANQTNNIMIAGTENSKITTNSDIIINSDINTSKGYNIGVYLEENSSYINSTGSISVKNSSIGIYANKGAGILENIKVSLTSEGVQTIGVVLLGENLENKQICGEIDFLSLSNVQEKDIGVYAEDSNVVINKNLIFNNNKTNGIGLYLKNSRLSGNGSIKILGAEVDEGNTTHNNIGIFFFSDNINITSNSSMKIEIDKSSTIGMYLGKNTILQETSQGNLVIGNTANIVKNVTGVLVSNSSTFNNNGNITLNNTELSVGIAGLGGVIVNNGNIYLAGHTTSDIGIFLDNNSSLTNKGTISISQTADDTGVGIGIYTQGKDTIINSAGNFNMSSGNVAIYSEGTNISCDILLADNKNINKNKETIALIVKSENNTTNTGTTKTIVGGNSSKKMNITLARGATGIYVLDSNVTLSNLSIIDSINSGKDNDLLSHGIFLNYEENGEYDINNTNIYLVKGVGIVVGAPTNNQPSTTKLILKNDNITINSYLSEKVTLEAGIGVYSNSGNIELVGGNKIYNSYGIGIFSGQNSNISMGYGTTQDLITLQGEAIGIYSKSGIIDLGEKSVISFKNSISNPISSGTYQGIGVYTIDGNVNSSAIINNTTPATSNGIIGLLGKQKNDFEVTIKNNGNISLSGNSVVGIVTLGNVNSSKNITAINDGVISISGTKGKLSTGILGENSSITNNGKLTIGDFAYGIFYKSDKKNSLISSDIFFNGANSVGIILTGNTESVNIKNINTSKNMDRNLGIYLNNFSTSSATIENVSLNDYSMGVYITSSNTTLDKVGNIKVGYAGIGLAVVENSINNSNNVTINNSGSITAGENGIGAYVKNTTLTISSLFNWNIGKNGAFVHINNGKIKLKDLMSELELDSNIGMIIENNGDIEAINGKTLSKILIKNGGKGILIRNTNTKLPSILSNNTTLVLDSGIETDYSIGVYYQNVGNITNHNFKFNYANNAQYTIGSIYDKAYGELNNFQYIMAGHISNSIGSIIRNDYSSIPFKQQAGLMTLKAGGDNLLLNINGYKNIGLISKNSLIETIGDIKVGITDNRYENTGVYLFATDPNFQFSYKGEGIIDVRSHNTGVFAKNYDLLHNGNIFIDGKYGIGMVLLNTNTYLNKIDITNDIFNIKNGGIGVVGKNSDITTYTNNLSVIGEHSAGVLSLYDGNIYFNGSATISGKNSSGIYKNTVTEELTPQFMSDNLLNNIIVENGNWNIDNLANGIVAIARFKDENGNITKIGNSISINNKANMTLGNGSIGIYSVGRNSIENYGDMTIGGALIEGDKTYASIGIYMANQIGGVNPYTYGNNYGTLTIEKNGGIGIQAVGYINFNNNKEINVSQGGVGMQASYGANIINKGEISVLGKGAGMIAIGKDSLAINEGIITLKKDTSSSKPAVESTTGDTQKYNTQLVGMASLNGGNIINSKNGVINVEDGVGMYIDSYSSFINAGTINVNGGVGIMGVGTLMNTGVINVISGSSSVELDKNLSDKGTIEIDKKTKTLKINDNFTNVGGILETDYSLELNNPTVDISAGTSGFIAPEITGDIHLDSNFALLGNGTALSIENFIVPNAEVNINTSPLFKPVIQEGNLNINKVNYKDITVGNQYDERDDSLDKILMQGGTDAEILKNLNYYLDSLGTTTQFDSEANKFLGAIGGNVYSNIQARIQKIEKTFDNSFYEMLNSPILTYDNSKFHIISTDGESKNDNQYIPNYSFDIKGINYMTEYDSKYLNKKYGYLFGFTGSKFNLKDNFGSNEDIYSLRSGIYQINYFNNNISLLTKGEIGYNHHRINRKVSIPNTSENGEINNRAWYGSYLLNLENKLRKDFLFNNNIIGVYTGLNVEYGIFDDIKEKGNLELKVQSNDYFSSKFNLGIDENFSIPLNDNWGLRINGNFEYSYDFGNNYSSNKIRFKSQDRYYHLVSTPKSKDSISTKLDISFDKNDYLSLTLSGEISQDFKRNEKYWSAGILITYKINNF